MDVMTPIKIEYTEGSDYNSKPIARINGIALTPTEQILAEKLNEIMDFLYHYER